MRKGKYMTLKAVIFDMDGVLTATVENHYQSWKKALEGLDIPFTREVNEKLLGLTRQRSLEVILGNQHLDNSLKQEILHKKNEYYIESIQKMTPAHLHHGAIELLEELRSNKIRLGVASGSSNTQLVLNRLGIDNYFQAVYDSKIIKRSKPAPDAFLIAAEALHVEPFECCVLEDSEAGVQAGLEAGMCVIGIGPEERLKHAHAVVNNLAQINSTTIRATHLLWSLVSIPEKSGYIQSTQPCEVPSGSWPVNKRAPSSYSSPYSRQVREKKSNNNRVDIWPRNESSGRVIVLPDKKSGIRKKDTITLIAVSTVTDSALVIVRIE